MSVTEFEQIDLTEPGDHLRYVEVLTPGGIVRVNTNLVDTRTGRPVVAVEVEPNIAGRPRTADEEWHVSWADQGTRFVVRPVREKDPQ